MAYNRSLMRCAPLTRSAALALLLAACDGRSEAPAAPAEGAPTVDAAPATPATPAAPAADETAAPATLDGRWQGQEVCLELFGTTGEFELSLLLEGPKIVISGTFEQTRGEDGVELTLHPARIRRHRWIGPCRETVIGDALLDEADALGLKITRDAAFKLRLQPRPGGEVELCGERCDRLAPAPRNLVGRWRHPALHRRPDEPSEALRAGDLLDIDVAERGGIWVGADERSFYHVYGDLVLRHQGGPRFEVTFTPTMIADLPTPVPAGLDLKVLGLPVALGAPLRLQLRRIADFGLEVCAAADRCVSLPAYDPVF